LKRRGGFIHEVGKYEDLEIIINAIRKSILEHVTMHKYLYGVGASHEDLEAPTRQAPPPALSYRGTPHEEKRKKERKKERKLQKR
jgi:hypothetical protein